MRRLAILAFALAAASAHGFKLQVWGSSQPPLPAAGANRQERAFMRQFTLDVHERITSRAYAMANLPPPGGVIAGVRWNDNPPAIRIGALFGGCGGTLPEGVACWASMMRLDRLALEALLRREKGFAPLRSHFGDMQFLHAMAARAGESPEQTRRNILRWSEFAYRVARGEIDPKTNVYQLSRNRTALDSETAAWISDLFRGPGKQLWTVHDIFLPISSGIRPMAWGTILHLVEDSYSAAHLRRQTTRVQSNGCLSYDAGDPIVRFHTYGGQDAEKHGVCDDAPDWLDTPRPGSPLEVIAELARAYDAGAEWPVVRAILEDKVLRFADSVSPSAPGRCFEWHEGEASSAASDSAPLVLAPCRQDEPQ